MRGIKRSRGGHGVAVDKGNGFTQHGQTGGAFDAFGGEVTAEGACSGSAREQAEQMACHGVQRRALGKARLGSLSRRKEPRERQVREA